MNQTNKNFKQINQMNKSEFQDLIIDWTSFYRKNIHRFIEHYLKIELHLYQIIILFLMNLYPTVVIVACRASAKSFMIAIFACAKCILYPNSKIVIASATKKQSNLIITEKIQKELMSISPNLANEIEYIKTGTNDTEVVFKNKSSIIVVPATDNARGNSAPYIRKECRVMI